MDAAVGLGFVRAKAKSPALGELGFLEGSLAVSYFHTARPHYHRR